MAIFTGSALGSILKLKCPHCGEVQARARKPLRENYACRRCRRRFTRQQGLDAAGVSDPYSR